MGNNQTTTKEAQSQGVCERIFKALKVRPACRYFRRVPTVRPQTQSPKSATKSRVATSDHHRNDPAKATGFKLVAQNGSTIPFELKGQQIMIPFHEKDHNLSFASNMVLVEYNHSSVDSTNNKSPVKNIEANVVRHINDGPNSVKSEDYSDTNRFSKYIDHVKNKMKIMSSFDDDDDDDDDNSGVGRAPTRRDSFNDKVDRPLQVQDQGAA